MKAAFVKKLQAILERKENRVSLQIGKTVRFGLSVANFLSMKLNGDDNKSKGIAVKSIFKKGSTFSFLVDD